MENKLIELKGQIEHLSIEDKAGLDLSQRRTHMLIDQIFGVESKYHNSLNGITFRPRFRNIGLLGGSINPESTTEKKWQDGKQSFINLLDVMIEDKGLTIIRLKNEGIQNLKEKTHHGNSNKIFIVHGHNEEMKQSVARTIEKLDLQPIILHEQANKGRTIIQKFMDHSDVGFAIILLSSDDYGFSKKGNPKDAKPRARQNVILELGFFLGKLGSDRVIAIFEQIDNFEIPSDYDGVIFLPYDETGRWKFDIIKELKVLNYNVDANKIV